MKILRIILVLFCPFLLQAQTEPSTHKWIVTIHVGPYAGISHPMKNTMMDQGFRPKSGNGWFGNTGPMPMVRQNWAVQLGMEIPIKNSWSGKLLLSELKGEILGISSQSGELDMFHSMGSAAFVVAYNFRDKASRLAVGPAVNVFIMEGQRFYAFTDPIKKTYTKIGFAIEAGFRFPAQSRFFFDYNSQFLWVGREDLGFYNFEEDTGNGQPNIFKFDAGKQSFNYFTFNFGFGIRFGKIKKQS